MLNKPFFNEKIELKNRLVMPPMATYCYTDEGCVTEKALSFYNERAKGGNIGLIITEHGFISRDGMAKSNQISYADDNVIEGLSELVKVIKQNGTKAIAQINHAGSASSYKVTGSHPVSASPVILPVDPPLGDSELPREMSIDDIKAAVRNFADAAARAKAAGFDGVEIHSAHSYLLNQFYSPLTNKRTDAYGGNPDNRIRFHLEIIEAVRAAVGNDYPVAIRLGGCDYTEGGSTIEDCVNACRAFERSGIDLLDLSGGMCRYTRPGHNEPGYFADMSKAVKEAVNIPVILTGGVKTPEDADTLLKEGAADLIGVGRELLKDPYWADRI